MDWLPLLATLVDFAGTLALAAAAGICAIGYLRRAGAVRVGDLDALRFRLAAGLVFALSLKSGAGILRTVTVTSWEGVAHILVIIGLRFFLGRVLKAQIGRNHSLPVEPPQ